MLQRLWSMWRQFAIEICWLAGGANKCKGAFDVRQLPVTTPLARILGLMAYICCLGGKYQKISKRRREERGRNHKNICIYPLYFVATFARPNFARAEHQNFRKLKISKCQLAGLIAKINPISMGTTA